VPTGELTELVAMNPERVDGVRSPASGFPILLMKAVNAQGGIDEKPDISGAENVMQQLARLIQSEASELAVGQWDEVCDIELLLQATHLMGCFRSREMYGDVDDGEAYAAKSADFPSADELGSAVTFLAKRKVSAAERKRLAAAGHALPDGSYPIESEEDLHNAAILARSGHGDVAAAKRLIAKRAKELGVANPLANDTAKDADVADDKNDKTSETPESQDKPQVEKSAAELVDEAVAKAVEPHLETIKGLVEQMAALKSTPIPGGPAITAPAAQRSVNERAAALADAARYDRLAKSISGNPELTRYYEDKAAEARKAGNG
jgi:hypothetical protein